MAQLGERSSITKLNNGNYQLWKFKVEMLLSRDDIWEIVTEKPPETITQEWSKRNRQGMATISLSVEDDQLIHIRKCKTAREMWEALQRLHERSNLTSKLYLLRKIYKIRLERDTSMQAHINAILEIVDRLRDIGEDMKDNHVAALILCSLPESYSTLITALEARPEAEITLELVKGKLIDEADRRRESKINGCSEEKVLLTTKHGEENGGQNTNGCFYCGKTGHFKRECRKLKAQKQKYQSKPKYKANIVTEKGMSASSNNTVQDSSNLCFSASAEQIRDGWFIDSGATSHMSCNKELFAKLDKVTGKITIILANGGVIDVEGIGEIYLECDLPTKGRTSITLKDVLYVPKLKGNLLSVKKIATSGCNINFEGIKCILKRGKELVGIGLLESDLYVLKCRQRAMIANDSTHDNCIHTWHRRLGHRNLESITTIKTKNLAQGIHINRCKGDIFCEPCTKGKLSRKPFPKLSTSRASKPFQLIHSDVCGPMKTTTIGGKRYIVTFIDDYSRYTVIYLLTHKSEVENKLKEYIASGYNKFGCMPEFFRSDRGGEYLSKEIDIYLKGNGIRRQNSTPYSPQQNGVAERKNRSLTEMGLCMLIDAKLDNCYWGEAVMTSNYLQNRLPHSSCARTPFELWNGKQPKLDHIKIFGCKAFSHVPNEKRTKFEEKAIEGILVGYSEESKAYRILQKDTNRIIISRTVIFDEKAVSAAPLNNVNIEVLQTSSNADSQMFIDEIQPIKTETLPVLEENIDLRRSTRVNFGIPAERLTFLAKANPEEPELYEDLDDMGNIERESWLKAMKEEIESLQKNNTWDLVDLPKGKKSIGCKWVFKAKQDGDGNTIRHKARVVAKGYTQKFGSDYDQVFAPVVKYSTVRTLLSVASKRGMKTRHLDVKSAFLYGDIQEELYMDQPPGYIIHGKEEKVCRLKKGIYGLKQSARAWNDKVNDLLSKNGFERGSGDQCLYVNFDNEVWTYILLYVDDFLVCSDSEDMIQNVTKLMEQHFEVKDLGEAEYYLGIQISKNANGSYSLSQKGKIKELVEKFGLDDGKPTSTPMETDFTKGIDQNSPLLPNNDNYRQAIGSLLYIATVCRPDIAAAVGILGRKVSKPTQKDWNGVKRVIKYLGSSIEKTLTLNCNGEMDVAAYADADWGGDLTDRKSTTGFLILVGGAIVSWTSRKQSCVAMSSTEAEYVSAANACQEILWMHILMKDLGYTQIRPSILFEDNQSCIRLSQSEKLNARTKHIDVRFHLLKDLCAKGTVKLSYCATEKMLADILTKPLPKPKFVELVKMLGVC